jgi:hypothetical protein
MRWKEKFQERDKRGNPDGSMDYRETWTNGPGGKVSGTVPVNGRQIAGTGTFSVYRKKGNSRVKRIA